MSPYLGIRAAVWGHIYRLIHGRHPHLRRFRIVWGARWRRAVRYAARAISVFRNLKSPPSRSEPSKAVRAKVRRRGYLRNREAIWMHLHSAPHGK